MKNLICQAITGRLWLPVAVLLLLSTAADIHGAMLYKNYVVRYDRGWDILCDPYQIQRGDWVLKIFRQKGEIANADFREFLGIFQRLNPHVKDIDRIRPGQVVDIPLKKLAQGNLPGQSSGVVTIPFVMLNKPMEKIEKHTRSYTVKSGDTVSRLITKHFGGRYGNLTYSQGVKLFKAANPNITDINRIYTGQKIYMPDPSIREQSWYQSLFDEAGNLVTEGGKEAVEKLPAPLPAANPAPVPAPPQAAPSKDMGPAAEAAAAMGGILLNKGTYFLPMQQGSDFELDLSRHSMIDMQNGSKVILTRQDRVMNVDLPLIQSYWKDVKAVKIPEKANAQQILEAVLSAFSEEETTDQLAFDDGGINISVSAKWIRSEASPDGSVPRHTCITPIMRAAQQTHPAVVRYLDLNDIVIKDILATDAGQAMAPVVEDFELDTVSIDGSSQKALIAAVVEQMGFRYSPDTSISFPYAGIQVKALSNLLSFGNGRDILVDFGDLYGDAVDAIRQTGLDILQINVESGAVEIIQQLLDKAGMTYTRSPVLYGADRPAKFNSAITVYGILVTAADGHNRLFVDKAVPEMIQPFIRDQGIQLIRIQSN